MNRSKYNLVLGMLSANKMTKAESFAQAALRELMDEIDTLRAALQFAREWGLSGKGYDASAAHSLARWVDAGMTGDLPSLPAYLQPQ